MTSRDQTRTGVPHSSVPLR